MHILGWIIIVIAIVPYLFMSKDKHRAMNVWSYPLAGAGLIMVSIGNFMNGEMLGRDSSVRTLTGRSGRELWTMEDDPGKFVFVNGVFVLLGLGLILWGVLRKRD